MIRILTAISLTFGSSLALAKAKHAPAPTTPASIVDFYGYFRATKKSPKECPRDMVVSITCSTDCSNAPQGDVLNFSVAGHNEVFNKVGQPEQTDTTGSFQRSFISNRTAVKVSGDAATDESGTFSSPRDYDVVVKSCYEISQDRNILTVRGSEWESAGTEIQPTTEWFNDTNCAIPKNMQNGIPETLLFETCTYARYK
jgi:hypothetical protein